MLELLSRRWWLAVLRGVVAVLFGVLALAWPGLTVLALVILWGIYALADGAVAVATSLLDRGHPAGHRALFGALGVIGVLAGVVAIAWPGETAVVLLTIIAVWALLAGVVQIVAAIRLRAVLRNEWFLGVTGALTVVLGIVLLVRPGAGAVALVTTIAMFSVLWGVCLVLFGLRLRQLGRRARREPGVAAAV